MITRGGKHLCYTSNVSYSKEDYDNLNMID